MSNFLRFAVRFIASLVLIVVVVCALPGAMSSSSVNAFNGSIKIFLPKINNGAVKIFLPIVSKPAVVTAFGVFLDASGVNDGLAQMSAAGASWVRVDFYWSKVEASPGQFKWGNVTLENKLKAISSSHMNAILYINDTPGWALKSGYTCGAVAQDKFPDLAVFLSEMVKRYSAAPFNVKYFELWNEPDVSGLFGCWGDPTDHKYFGGGYYGEMLKVAYPAIKIANPQAQVLFGGLLMDCDPDHVAPCGGNPTDKRRIGLFLEGALVAGAGQSFDGISFHAYDYYGAGLGQYSNIMWGAAWNTTGPVALVKEAYLRNLLAQYNITGKYLINTELAILCGSDSPPGTPPDPHCTTDDHQQTVSAYIVQAMAGGKSIGLTANIWFSVAGWRGSGLLGPNLDPLPSYFAYKVARTKLGEATFVRAVTEFNGVMGYEFTNNGHRLWVLWSTTAAGNLINLESTPAAVSDIYGNAIQASNSLEIGLMPVYVEF